MAAVLEQQTRRWTYEESREYWIGDPANKSLEILTLSEKGYALNCSAEEKGKLTSPFLAGLEFDLEQVCRVAGPSPQRVEFAKAITTAKLRARFLFP